MEGKSHPPNKTNLNLKNINKKETGNVKEEMTTGPPMWI